jgi:hypothetical protein
VRPRLRVGSVSRPLNFTVRRHKDHMPTVRALFEIALTITLVGQTVLLWLQLSALRKYRHGSFVALALGTSLGLLYSAVAFLITVAPSAVPSPGWTYLGAMILGAVQVPVAIWGSAWLFRSYGQLYRRS